MDVFSTDSTSRRWGIDLVGGLFAAGSIFVLATYRDPRFIVMACVITAGVILLTLGIGLLTRFGPARPVTVAFLWIAIALDVFICLLFLIKILGLLAEYPALEPKGLPLQTVSRAITSWYILSYLTRADVKAEFN